VKQLVQILVHGDGLRNTEGEPVTAVQEILLSQWKVVSRSQAYTDPGRVQDGLLSALGFSAQAFSPKPASAGA
jgi:hypothetical protein